MIQNNKISFRLVAYTDAAGKFSPDAVRNGNEDNFYVDENLTDNSTNKVARDEIIQLGYLGMIMAVADGMGGMNAGEVASQIAIDTVKAAFTANSISDDIIANAQTRQKYLEQVIKTADKNIKSEARKDRSREGMGSTIIMAWLFGDELTISWCGDSRAYIFNEKSGIRLISQDHSYVQELVNKGLITYEQSFDHPQNNIITRSLGDPSKEALPESKTLKVKKGDIILLCSDGLSGVLRDKKTFDSNGKPLPEDNLEDIIRANSESMKNCREALWEAAEKGGWYDNVTAILCQITDGPERQWPALPAISPRSNTKRGNRNAFLFLSLGILVVLTIVVAIYIKVRTAKSNSIIEPTTDSMYFRGIDGVPTTKTVDREKSESHDTQELEAGAELEPVNQDVRAKQIEEKEDTVSSPKHLVRDNKDEWKDSRPVQDGVPSTQKRSKQDSSNDNPTLPTNQNMKQKNIIDIKIS